MVDGPFFIPFSFFFFLNLLLLISMPFKQKELEKRREAQLVEEQKRQYLKETETQFSKGKQPEFIPLSSGASLSASFVNKRSEKRFGNPYFEEAMEMKTTAPSMSSFQNISMSSSSLSSSSSQSSSSSTYNPSFPRYSDSLSSSQSSHNTSEFSNRFTTTSNYRISKPTSLSHPLETYTPSSISSPISTSDDKKEVDKPSYLQYIHNPTVIPLGYSVETNAPFSLSEIMRSQQTMAAQIQQLKNKTENLAEKTNNEDSLFSGKVELKKNTKNLNLFQDDE
jgi:hypothetical protein